MTETSASAGRSQISRLIKAPRPVVYRAFLDPEALAAWMAPDSMRLHVHAFDARAGGQFRISLTYPAADAGRGKTESDTDTYHGRFAQLVPNEKIVEVIEFETQDPGFMGEMTMTVTLTDVPEGTAVTLQYDNMPSAVRPEDNEAGTRSSLQKLAELLES